MPFFQSRAKKLPNLSEYVTRMAQRSPESGLGQALGCMLAVAATGGFFFFVERFLPIWFAGILSVMLALPLSAAIASAWIKHLSRPRTEEQERRKQAHEAIVFMSQAAEKGKLHRRIDRAVGMLLEECASYWLRIQNALGGAFWEDKDLPQHWKNIREQSLAAADRAMDDIVVLLTPVLEPRQKPTPGQEFLGDVLETFLNVPADGPVEPLPPAFLPARDMATKLMLLAQEVESTAQRAAKDEAFRETYSSSTQIDQVLSELRAIKVAEEELHQEIGHPPDER